MATSLLSSGSSEYFREGYPQRLLEGRLAAVAVENKGQNKIARLCFHQGAKSGQ